mmetsp:Transcript_35859/g.88314  ORF Transcript_35859/g.88314 Transcript_35859/m.88314 type:complete len:151 (+) Transcript_35859:2-454(+)
MGALEAAGVSLPEDGIVRLEGSVRHLKGPKGDVAGKFSSQFKGTVAVNRGTLAEAITAVALEKHGVKKVEGAKWDPQAGRATAGGGGGGGGAGGGGQRRRRWRRRRRLRERTSAGPLLVVQKANNKDAHSLLSKFPSVPKEGGGGWCQGH